MTITMRWKYCKVHKCNRDISLEDRCYHNGKMITNEASDCYIVTMRKDVVTKGANFRQAIIPPNPTSPRNGLMLGEDGILYVDHWISSPIGETCIVWKPHNGAGVLISESEPIEE